MTELPNKFNSLVKNLVHKDGYYEINIKSTEIELVFELLRLDQDYLSLIFENIFKDFRKNTNYFPPEAITEFKNFIYRGQSNYKWNLVPNSLRDINESNKPYTKNELEKLLLFLKCCDEIAIPTPHDSHRLRDNIQQLLSLPTSLDGNNWITADYYELLGYAQHYGLSTRLLDWSYHYLVGLYFASIPILKEQKSKPKYFSLFILCTDNLETKTHDNCVKIDIPSGLNKHISLQQGCFVLVKQSQAMNTESAKRTLGFFGLENELEIQNINDILKNNQQDFRLLKLNFPNKIALQVFKYCNSMGFNASNLFEKGEALKLRLAELDLLKG